MSNKDKWKLKYSPGGALGETGDYNDGTYELTNGKGIVVYTMDEMDEEQEKQVVKALNETECRWWVDDSDSYILHCLQKDIADIFRYLDSKGLTQECMMWTMENPKDK